MTKQDNRPLFLVDISSFIFRAYYAVRPLSTPKGEPVNAVYGVATMLDRTIKEGGAENIAIVFDSKEPSFRKQAYDEYKANRSAPPDDLIPQFDRIEALIQAMGLKCFRKSGVEADDIIATLAKHWVSLGSDRKVIIVSGDKDLMQLVDGQISMWDTLTGKTYTPKEVFEKFEVTPEQIRDYLALIGDSSDNIPGVSGIGPKSAVELLKHYHNLEGVLSAAAQDKIAGKKGVTIKEQIKMARLSYELVTLKTDVKVPLDQDLIYFPKMSEKLAEILKELDFKKLLEKWTLEMKTGDEKAFPTETSSETVEEQGASTFVTIDELPSLKKLIAEIRRVGMVSIDLETTSLNPRQAAVVGIALCTNENQSYYVPVGHRSLGEQGKQIPIEKVYELLKPIIEDPKIKKIGQNLKYDWSVLEEQGIHPQGLFADTMLADYLLRPESRHNMETLAQTYLDYQVVTFEQVCGKGKDALGFDQVSIAQATRYSAEDAWVALKLWNRLEPQLKSEEMEDLFRNIEVALVPVLSKMERKGVCIDEPFLRKLSRQFETELNEIQKTVEKINGGPLNLNSPKQLGKLLFEDLKLPTQGKTKTGFSTDATVLEALAPLHEVPRQLLEYREISKLKGTYIDPLPLLKDPSTGRIHTSFHQAVAATGRLSSSDPNLQNIPIRTQRGRLIRQAFVPSDGNVFMSADYSQIELRILAHLSDDEELCRAFRDRQDVHRRTAAEIFGIPEDKVSDEERSYAKAINFGLMYGKTPFGLSQELKIPRKQAQEMIDKYFARYHRVKSYLDGQIELAKSQGFVRTLLGRKRNLPDIHAKNPAMRGFAERMAMNSPIQGTAADMIKLAMIKLDQSLTEQRLKASMIIQVHDELVLEVPHDEVDEVKGLVRSTMENAMKLSVPLEVNLSTGLNWAEL